MFRSSAGNEPARVFSVTDPSQVSEARRGLAELARASGFDETVRGKVALVVTELASNLTKHGGGGFILAQPVPAPTAGIDVIAVDRGTGIRDVSEALRDGFSTAGSPGTGLGAVRRLAAAFDLYSQATRGTAVFARILATPAPSRAADWMDMDVDGFSLAGSDDPVSGDGWALHQTAECTSTLVVDGLGHGTFAADAARAAIFAFRDHPGVRPQAMLHAIHAALRGTRGAAAAVAQVDRDRNSVRFAGIGNITATLVRGDSARYLVSHNGILGHNVHRIDEFTYPWTPDTVFVQHSDGLGTRWNLGSYAGLALRHPALVAAVLYRDHYRGRDDVTVLVARGAQS